MTGPRDLPELNDKPPYKPYDDSEDGIAGYLPELREDSYHHGEEEAEDEDDES
jgi:hypothetical protein